MGWKEDAVELYGSGTSWKIIVDKLQSDYPNEHLNRDRIRDYIRWNSETYKEQHSKLTFEDKKASSDEDVELFYDLMIQSQEALDAIDTKQTKATVTINDDKPIAVALWGDWHIGGRGVDYKRLDRDAEKIANTDGLYWVGMGDYKDNYQSYGHVGAQYEQIMQPGMQDKAVLHRIKDVADNNIALVRGCHDDWDYKTGNRDFIEAMCDITGGVNLWHGGDLTIKHGSAEYLFKVRHKYKFESSLNLENAMRRIMEIQGPCDVAASAHLHNPYYMERHLMGEFRVMCRSGSYKIWDEFGQKIAGYKGKPGIPTMILFPDKKRIIPMFLNDAITVLKALRS